MDYELGDKKNLTRKYRLITTFSVLGHITVILSYFTAFITFIILFFGTIGESSLMALVKSIPISSIIFGVGYLIKLGLKKLSVKQSLLERKLEAFKFAQMYKLWF